MRAEKRDYWNAARATGLNEEPEDLSPSVARSLQLDSPPLSLLHFTCPS
ncbi:hypothetical protein ACFFLM_08890 [Deinococcus oregonensis]|uniref:Uncharacterized protein n=1 Tax=Deinococcus oregonensis TaxID=1805970 RepID=A0ABV6AZB3_9DEIO